MDGWHLCCRYTTIELLKSHADHDQGVLLSCHIMREHRLSGVRVNSLVLRLQLGSKLRMSRTTCCIWARKRDAPADTRVPSKPLQSLGNSSSFLVRLAPLGSTTIAALQLHFLQSYDTAAASCTAVHSGVILPLFRSKVIL